MGLHGHRRRLGNSADRLRLRRRSNLRPRLSDAFTSGLAHYSNRGLAPLGLQHRCRGSAHSRGMLCRLWRIDRDWRHFLRGALGDRRRRHWCWPRDYGTDCGGAGRHQSRRRQRLGRKGVRRNADRPPDHQWADHNAGAGRHQSHGARVNPHSCRRHRCSLAQESLPYHQQGVCQSDLPSLGTGAINGSGKRHGFRR